jgi:hypothetical protein
MNCPVCFADVKEGKRFCGQCGTDLTSAPMVAPEPSKAALSLCSGCGREVASGKSFCGACGKPVAAPVYDSPRISAAGSQTENTKVAQSVALDDIPPSGSELHPLSVLQSDVVESNAGQADWEPESHGRKTVVILGTAAALCVLAALGWWLWPSPQAVLSAVEPRITVRAGANASIGVAIYGKANDVEVNWSVREGDLAGSVHSDGATIVGGQLRSIATYSAPIVPGTYHIVASSKRARAPAEIEVVVGANP